MIFPKHDKSHLYSRLWGLGMAFLLAELQIIAF